MQANEVIGAVATTEERVRRRLRELRVEQGRTLQQVAEAANLAVSTLSRLESGKRRLALDHLPNLARALGVSVDDLLVDTQTVDPLVHQEPEFGPGVTSWPLSRRGFHGVKAFRFRFHEASAGPPDELPTHPGLDWLYVLSGELRLILGDQEYRVVAGDAVEFSTMVPHWFGAVGGPAEVIGILGPDGQDAHGPDRHQHGTDPHGTTPNGPGLRGR